MHCFISKKKQPTPATHTNTHRRVAGLEELKWLLKIFGCLDGGTYLKEQENMEEWAIIS